MAKRRPLTEETVSDATPRAKPRVLWYVLSALYLAGAGSAIVGLFALANVMAGFQVLLWLPIGVLGIAGGLFCLYLTLGVLYRVDRYRGNLTRRVQMFE